MGNGTVKDLWDGTNLDDQKEVNKAIKDTMIIISPAIEKVWNVNLKVNIIYAVLTFCVIASGIIFGIIQLCKDKAGS